jgi:hypothetical protein
MAPQTTQRIWCRALDDVLVEEKVDHVTAIKLDTQGTELDILRGSVGALTECAFVDVEVEFNPLYEGAGLFCDLDRFLRDHGMVLWRLESLVHYAPVTIPAAATNVMIAGDPGPTSHCPVPNGQLFWGQAHYVRAEYPLTGAATIAARSALEGAIMAGTYGYWDLALDVLIRSPHAELLPTLQQLLAL